MIYWDDFNQDIDHNWTATEILKERAPHLLYELQNEFYELHLAEGNIKTDVFGKEYWDID